MLKALADETRWRIVHELLAAPATVNELTEKLGASQYNVSRHLSVLEDAGIVEKNRDGKHVRCQIAPDFRQQLSRNKNVLDLGCCSFRFDKPPR
jgi:DNA-binding transcriptional ArsR family regulator